MDELEGAVMSSASGSNSHVLTVAGRKGIFHVYKFSMMVWLYIIYIYILKNII
jgi:hypothetical protein